MSQYISESTGDLKNFNAVIFALGDVIFTWSAERLEIPIPPHTFEEMTRSSIFFEYQKGNLTESEAYQQIATLFETTVEKVEKSFIVVRDSIEINPSALDFVRLLESKGLRVFAMSNISAPDFEVLKGKASPQEWSLFDRVFTSYVINS
jgi:FMN phosphatase YigB (HAD superfamily)